MIADSFCVVRFIHRTVRRRHLPRRIAVILGFGLNSSLVTLMSNEPITNRHAMRWHAAILNTIVAAAYVGFAELGLALPVADQHLAAVWPASGLAVAVVLLWGFRSLPGIAIGAAAVGVIHREPPVTIIGITAAHTLEAFIGSWLLQRFIGLQRTFVRLKDVFGFVGLAATAGPALGAAIAVASLDVSGLRSWETFGNDWTTWWLGHAVGTIAVAPLILTWMTPRAQLGRPIRRVESIVLLALTLLTSYAVFEAFAAANTSAKFLVFPFAAWGAVRLGQRMATVVVAMIAVFAIWSVKADQPVMPESNFAQFSMIMLTFVGVVAVTSLALGAIIAERYEAEQALADAMRAKQLLLSELDHRVRNNLASLKSLIEMSAAGKTSVADFAAAIKSRVQAMAAAHLLLSRMQGNPVDIKKLLELLIPGDCATAVTCDGPPIGIPPKQLTSLGMVLQELITNSLKYGALSANKGAVHIVWQVPDDGAARQLQLSWTENGGPEIDREPPQTGIGSELIVGLVRHELGGSASLSYPRNGAAHRFVIRLQTAD